MDGTDQPSNEDQSNPPPHEETLEQQMRNIREMAEVLGWDPDKAVDRWIASLAREVEDRLEGRPTLEEFVERMNARHGEGWERQLLEDHDSPDFDWFGDNNAGGGPLNDHPELN